jgi:phosphoribosyl-AMP cyclohydrolase
MDINNVKWDDKGLIPAVIQDDSSMNVLMVGYIADPNKNFGQKEKLLATN